MKTLSCHITEKLATKEIDPSRFPSQYHKDSEYFERGHKDGDENDDKVPTKKIVIDASKLKASQDAVYLGKSLGLAIAGVAGGDLGSVVSKDLRILDGHHRWAASIFNNPKSKIIANQSNLVIGDLVPVLRTAGDALGNPRGLAPSGNAINIFKATAKDIENAIYSGVDMDPQFYDREKSIQWFEKFGLSELERRLKMIQKLDPPKGAPARKDMPKIEPEQVDKIANDLTQGKIDVRDPYVAEHLQMRGLSTAIYEAFNGNNAVNEQMNTATFTIYKHEPGSMKPAIIVARSKKQYDNADTLVSDMTAELKKHYKRVNNDNELISYTGVVAIRGVEDSRFSIKFDNNNKLSFFNISHDLRKGTNELKALLSSNTLYDVDAVKKYLVDSGIVNSNEIEQSKYYYEFNYDNIVVAQNGQLYHEILVDALDELNIKFKKSAKSIYTIK